MEWKEYNFGEVEKLVMGKEYFVWGFNMDVSSPEPLAMKSTFGRTVSKYVDTDVDGLERYQKIKRKEFDCEQWFDVTHYAEIKAPE